MFPYPLRDPTVTGGLVGYWRLLGFPGGSAGIESACNMGDLGSIPGLGKSPGEVKGYLLQRSDMMERLSLSLLQQ